MNRRRIVFLSSFILHPFLGAGMISASSRYDVIVAGVGGMGSATAYHLARRGRKVL
jgi:tRNA A37 threonylcarbamoyladenosine dehydratase